MGPRLKISLLFQVTAIAVFIQLALGGLVAFGFIDAFVHIIMGVIVLVIIATVMALRLKPRPRRLVGLSGGTLVLLLVQIILGLPTMGSGNKVVAWPHLVNALAIYGMMMAGLTDKQLRRRVKVPWFKGRYSLEDAFFQTSFEQAHHLGEIIAAYWQMDKAPPQMMWIPKMLRMRASVR